MSIVCVFVCLHVYFFLFSSCHLSCYQLTFQLLSPAGLDHVKVSAVFPVLTFYSFVTVTWFKLPLLPLAVRISLVYPLQLLLYISMKTVVFLSRTARYFSPTVAVHTTLSLGVHYF